MFNLLFVLFYFLVLFWIVRRVRGITVAFSFRGLGLSKNGFVASWWPACSSRLSPVFSLAVVLERVVLSYRHGHRGSHTGSFSVAEGWEGACPQGRALRRWLKSNMIVAYTVVNNHCCGS